MVVETYIDLFCAVERVEPEFANTEILELVKGHLPKSNAMIQPFFRHN